MREEPWSITGTCTWIQKTKQDLTLWKILHSHQRMMFLQNKGTVKASQTDLLASNITLNSTTRTNHLLVSRLYDTERPVQKYPQWKCSFTDQRIFVLLANLAQHMLIHMKAKKKRCLHCCFFLMRVRARSFSARKFRARNKWTGTCTWIPKTKVVFSTVCTATQKSIKKRYLL